MNVAFRVDASGQIGTGHFFRCLTLADALRQCGWEIRFVGRHLPDELQKMLSAREVAFSAIGGPDPDAASGDLAHARWPGAAQDRDAAETAAALSGNSWEWVVVDHHALDARWETALRRCSRNIAVIDDLADRPHDCDLLLDQNLAADAAGRYAGKVPAGCRLLLGPAYALLREEFRTARRHLRARGGAVTRLLISFSGVDALDHTSHAIEAVAGLRTADLQVDVVVGSANPRREEIAAQCNRHGYVWHVQTDRMAELMAEADLAIGAGGLATWERCSLGLPTLAVCAAENQKQQIVAAACDGLLLAPDPAGERVAFIRQHMRLLLDNAYLRSAISRAGMRAVDGEGVWRFVRHLTRSDIEMRMATVADSDDLFSWRNDPAVRAASRIPDLIDMKTHQRWVASAVTSDDRILLIGDREGAPVGVVRFDLRGNEAEISIYLVPGPHPPGEGRSLLRCAEQWLAANRPSVDRIRAHVLAGNERSARVFLGAGYVIEFADYSKRIERQ